MTTTILQINITRTSFLLFHDYEDGKNMSREKNFSAKETKQVERHVFPTSYKGGENEEKKRKPQADEELCPLLK